MLCKMENGTSIPYSKVDKTNLSKIKEIKMVGLLKLGESGGLTCYRACEAVQWGQLTSLEKITVENSYFSDHLFVTEIPSLKTIEFKKATIEIDMLNSLLVNARNIEKIEMTGGTHYDQDENAATADLNRRIAEINEHSGVTTLPDDEYEEDSDDSYSDSSSDSGELNLKLIRSRSNSDDSLDRSTDTESEDLNWNLDEDFTVVKKHDLRSENLAKTSISIATAPFVSETAVEYDDDRESIVSSDNKSKAHSDNELRTSVASTVPRGVKLSDRSSPNIANRQSRRTVEPLVAPAGVTILCKLAGEEDDATFTDYSVLSSNDLSDIEEMYIIGSGNEETNIITDVSWEGLTGLKKLTVANACIAAFNDDERLIDLPKSLEELHIAQNCAVNYDGLEMFDVQTYLTKLELETGFQRASNDKGYIQANKFSGTEAVTELREINRLISARQTSQPIDDTMYDEEFETDSVADKTPTRSSLLITCRLEGDNPFMDSRDYTTLTDTQKSKIVALSILGTGKPEDCSIAGAIDWSKLKQLRSLDIAHVTFNPKLSLFVTAAAWFPNLENVEFTNCGLDTRSLNEFAQASGSKLQPFTINNCFDSDEGPGSELDSEIMKEINDPLATRTTSDEVDMYSNLDEFENILRENRGNRSVSTDNFEWVDDLLGVGKKKTGKPLFDDAEDESDETHSRTDTTAKTITVDIFCTLSDGSSRTYANLTTAAERKEIVEMIILGDDESKSKPNILNDINWSELTNLKSLDLNDVTLSGHFPSSRNNRVTPVWLPNIEKISFTRCGLNMGTLSHLARMSGSKLDPIVIEECFDARKGLGSELDSVALETINSSIRSRYKKTAGAYSNQTVISGIKFTDIGTLNDPSKGDDAPFIYCQFADQEGDEWFSGYGLTDVQLGNITALYVRGTHRDQRINSDIAWDRLKKLKNLTIENATVTGDLLEDSEETEALFPDLATIKFGRNCTVDVDALDDFNYYSSRNLQSVEYRGTGKRVQEEITSILQSNAGLRALRADVNDKVSKPRTATTTAQRTIKCWLKSNDENVITFPRNYDELSGEERANIDEIEIIGKSSDYDLLRDPTIEWEKLSSLSYLTISNATIAENLETELPLLKSIVLSDCRVTVAALNQIPLIAGQHFNRIEVSNLSNQFGKKLTLDEQESIAELTCNVENTPVINSDGFIHNISISSSTVANLNLRNIQCWLKGDDRSTSGRNYDDLSKTQKKNIEVMYINGANGLAVSDSSKAYQLMSDSSIQWDKLPALKSLSIYNAQLSGKLSHAREAEFFPNLEELSMTNCIADVDTLYDFRDFSGEKFNFSWGRNFSTTNDPGNKKFEAFHSSTKKPEKQEIWCQLKGGDKWFDYSTLNLAEIGTIEVLHIDGTNRMREVNINWNRLKNLRALTISGAEIPNFNTTVNSNLSPYLFPDLEHIVIQDCNIAMLTLRSFYEGAGALKTCRMENLQRADGSDFSKIEKASIAKFQKGPQQQQRSSIATGSNMSDSPSTLFGNTAHGSSKRAEIPITSTGNVDPRTKPRSPMMNSTQRYRGMGVDSIYHSTEEDKPTRTVEEIGERLLEGLVEVSKSLNGKSLSLLLNYKVEEDEVDDIIHLNYVASSQKSSAAPIRVLDIDAESETVTVYKSWSTQVDKGNKNLPLQKKALLVLHSLGIPPCPPDIEISKTKSPLAAEVRKQFTRLQKEEELQKTNDMESGDDDVMHVRVKK